MTHTKKINYAFVLAAGLGKRLRPYTDTLPKPMVPVAGRPVIDWILDHLAAIGVENVTVNLHHMADILEAHLKPRTKPRVTLSHETELLETGGGIKKALPTMQGEDFFIINGDAFWFDGPDKTALQRVADAWDPTKMDILLMLQPVNKMALTKGVGDYSIADDGRITRQKDLNGTHMFAGIRVCKPMMFDDTPEGPFSFLQLMDKAEQSGRLYAVVHDGDWHHISTPEELDRVNAASVATLEQSHG